MQHKLAMKRVNGQEVETRFARVGSAPICQGTLFWLLGYKIDTATVIAILERRFEVLPPDTNELTLLLLEEMANIWQMIKNDELDIAVIVDDFNHYWRRAKERTTSSYSKLHFGHYKLAVYPDYLLEVHALKFSLISKTGSASERWARGLLVMLEKIVSVAVVTKFWSILLIEADFNFHNKLIFGKRMMDLARRHGIVPEKIYSKEGRMVEDAVLHQVLAYDIARQKQDPLIVALIDAAQCYNRIAHSIAALSMRAAKVPENLIRCMLKPI